MWGTAVSTHKVEGNNSNSEWCEWELRGRPPKPSARFLGGDARADKLVVADS